MMSWMSGLPEWRGLRHDGAVERGAMGKVIAFGATARRDDGMWGVVATLGRRMRVASIYATRQAALADCEWRMQQVAAYRAFLRQSGQPVPVYSIRPVRRTDLPRGWRPLPALGFLRGQLF